MLSGTYQDVAFGYTNSPGYSPSSLRCGVNHGTLNDFSGKKYVHWPSPIGANASVAICVASCPSKGSTVCSTAANHGGHCWATTWDTQATLYRCKVTSCSATWTASECDAAKMKAMASFPSLTIRLFADVLDGWMGMAAGVLAGVVVGYAWLWLTHSKAAASVRIASGLSLTAAIVFCVLILLNTGTMDTSGNADTKAAMSSASEDRSSYATLLLGLGVLVLIMLQLSMICYITKREDQAAFVVREAAVAMRAIPNIMTLPLSPILIVLVVTSVWVLVLFALLSISELSVGGPILHGIAGGCLVLSLLWITEMCAVVANITTAGAVCEWYWSTPGDLKVVANGALCHAMMRGCRYGLGTVARASLNFMLQGWISDACTAIRTSANPKADGPACQR